MSRITSKTLVIGTLPRVLTGVLLPDRFQLQADVCSGLVAAQALAVDPNVRDRTESIERTSLNWARGALLSPRSGLNLVISAVAALAGDGSERGRHALGCFHGQFAGQASG